MIALAPANISAQLMARVLLVEHEPNIASIIVFKLVLLDSSLPGGDAFALLTTLVAKHPVVMMTEFRDTTTPERARAAGAVVPATAGRP
jgi:DNA-binding response OmpR family regulator